MALHLSWFNNEETAFRVRYEPGWTWKQHHAMIQQIIDLRKERHLPRSLCLFDIRGTTLPFDSLASEHYHEPSEGSFIVIVIDNQFTRTIAQLAIRARDQQHLIRLVSTLEEGEALMNACLAQTPSVSTAQFKSRR